MAGRLYRMAKVVSANPKSWGIVDANEISGFKRVAKLSDLYSIAECILSSSYGDGVTDGADAVGQIWHVSETNGDYKLTNWANRKSAAGWTKLSYGDDVSVPVRDVHVNDVSVLSNGVAKIDLNSYLQNYATLTITDTLEGKINKNGAKINDNLGQINGIKNRIGAKKVNDKFGIAELDEQGYVPLKQLGNLDTVLFEVVTDLPNALNKIKKHIYLKTAGITGDENVYAEYIYTGGITEHDVYDATKWEKLGEVAAKTDLSEYYKKIDVDNKLTGLSKTLAKQDIEDFSIIPSFRGVQGVGKVYYMQVSISRKDGDSLRATIPCVVSAVDTTNANAGLMSPADKEKLDGIEAYANKYAHPHYTAASEGLYKISSDTFGHVFTTAAVTNKDIDPLVTVDSTLSSTSNHPVSSKAVYTYVNEYTVHTGNMNASIGDSILDGKYTIPFIDCDQIAEGYSPLHYANDAIIMTSQDGNINLKIDNSTFWSDSNLTALTDTELNNILN